MCAPNRSGNEIGNEVDCGREMCRVHQVQDEHRTQTSRHDAGWVAGLADGGVSLRLRYGGHRTQTPLA